MRKKEVDRLDAMVNTVAEEMKNKLRMKHREGKRGWEKDIAGIMNSLYRNEIQKDYLDVACCAAMLFYFQWRNRNRS